MSVNIEPLEEQGIAPIIHSHPAAPSSDQSIDHRLSDAAEMGHLTWRHRQYETNLLLRQQCAACQRHPREMDVPESVLSPADRRAKAAGASKL